jgi:hypothetical protein
LSWQTQLQRANIGFLHAATVVRILLFDIPEIEVMAGHRGQSCCMHARDVLNNPRSRSSMNGLEQSSKVMTYRNVLFPAPAVRSPSYRCKALIIVRKTYTFRESTGGTPSPSILLTHCSRRTMLRFLYVVLSKRSSDSSRDQGETASVERPFAAGHLQNTVGLGNERGGEK